jgi:hypothetical protein
MAENEDIGLRRVSHRPVATDAALLSRSGKWRRATRRKGAAKGQQSCAHNVKQRSSDSVGGVEQIRTYIKNSTVQNKALSLEEGKAALKLF